VPADAFAPPEKTPPLSSILDDVRKGLPRERQRLEEAARAERYYQFDNPVEPLKRRDEMDDDFALRTKRFSRITRTVVRKLAEPLYNPGPTRMWEGDASVQAWLDNVYATASINARMQSADRAATLSHVAALQPETTGDLKRPVRVWLWKAHEFAVFCPENDPITPFAVATIEAVPTSDLRVFTRYRVYTAWEYATFHSEPYGKGSMYREAATQVMEESGPSRTPGVLPFVFVRNEAPDSQFWAGGIGPALVSANAVADRRLTDIEDHIANYLDPIIWAKNIPANARLVRVNGEIMVVPNMPETKTGDMGEGPQLNVLQPTLGVESAWADLRAYLDTTLEELEVPLTVIRSDASTDLSGVAIVAKQLPLIDRTRARQTPFTETESELAAKMLAVAGVVGGDPALVAAARDPKLVCLWPEPKIPLPTPERNESDEWELRMGITSPLEVLARRRGITIQQAEEVAKQVAEQTAKWNAMQPEPAAEPADDNQDPEQEEPTDAEDEGQGDEEGR
jgi:hypothetical protein